MKDDRAEVTGFYMARFPKGRRAENFAMASISFDQWVQFTFGIGNYLRPFEGDYPGTPRDALDHCIRFFQNSREVLAHVPRAAAISALQDFPSIDGCGGLMSLPTLPEFDRFRLADRQVELFRDTFSADPFGDAAFLWWERLIGASWEDGPAVRSDRQVCDRIVGVLFEILRLESEECIRSALHGLSDFGPNSSLPPTRLRERIASAVLSRPGLSPQLRTYAQDVIDGNAP